VSVLVVGISHKTAPVAVLERLALDADGVVKLATDAAAAEHVTEATVIATCNRLEVYAEVDRFHGSIEEVSRLLVERSGETSGALVPHLYVHYDESAVAHLFHVASGLDSMAVGEAQILGQTRDALRLGQELGTVGPALNSLFQQALRVGKRAHAETDIDHAAPSMVQAALRLTGEGDHGELIGGKRVLVVGAGSMAALATATVARLGAAQVTVANRSAEAADRLATEHGATAVALTDLAAALADADVVITCAGATGLLVTRDMVERAIADGRPLLVVDLAMPHDVEPTVREVPGVTLVDLTNLAEQTAPEGAEDGAVDGAIDGAIDGVRRIVAEEVVAFASARRQASVTPTVVALRSMATAVVDAEVERLDTRLPGLDAAVREEVLQTIRRVADKLLHQPTVRVKELADAQDGVSYATALAELFSLDPDAVDAVTRASVQEERP
jgi:glutamyl-tRNA reductase